MRVDFLLNRGFLGICIIYAFTDLEVEEIYGEVGSCMSHSVDVLLGHYCYGGRSLGNASMRNG